MEKAIETRKLLIFKERVGKTTVFYRQHKDDPTGAKVKIYEKRGDTYTFEFEGKSIDTVVLEGFSTVPKLFSEYGYGFDEKFIQNFFKYKFEDDTIDTVRIADHETTRLDSNELIFNATDLEELQSLLNQEQKACNDTKSILIKNFMAENFPSLPFTPQETNNNKELILRNLNGKLIEKLTADEVEAIGRFYVDAAQKYKRPDVVKRMVLSLQKSAQLITLQEVIKKYEDLLASDPAESGWQSFFDEYITLFDNRYYKKIDYKNIATGVTKYPDIVLVDVYGYIDFYELKKSSTPILQYDKSHNTWYWTKEFSMVIAQAADYLQKARENSLSYAKSIKDQTSSDGSGGIDINIINPRAIIVAGTSKELNTPIKQNHFKNLRESLKDIEFVLYDELLQRLKNLLASVKVA